MLNFPNKRIGVLINSYVYGNVLLSIFDWLSFVTVKYTHGIHCFRNYMRQTESVESKAIPKIYYFKIFICIKGSYFNWNALKILESQFKYTLHSNSLSIK